MKTAEEFLDGTDAPSAEEFLSAEGKAPKAEEFLRGTEPKPKLGDWLKSPPIPVGSAADAATGLPAEYFHLRPDAKLPTAAESIRQETYQELSAGDRLLLDLLGPVQGAMSAVGGLLTGAGQTMAMGPVVDAEQPAVTQRQAAEQIRALKARQDMTPSELADLLENNPVTRQGRAVQAWTEKEFPNVIPPEEFRPAHTIGQGLGNFAPMVGLGLVGGTPAALGAGGLMEFSDAYDRELDRQRRDREAVDPVKAFNKAAVYSGIATGIEGGLGVGYVLRRIKAMFGDAGVEAFQRGGFRGLLGAVGKEMGKAGGAGATEEGLQRLVQDVLVEENKPLLERPDWGAIGEEALAGGGAQALTLGLAGGVAGWRGRKAAEAGGPAPRRRTEQVSEFGGLAEQENLPGTGGVEAAPAAETPTPPATAAAGPSAETPSPAQAAADNTGAVPTNESEVMPDAVQGQERTEGTEVETTPPVTSAGGAPAILLDQLRGATRRREAFPAQWLDQVNEGRDVPFALPEGYRRQGEQYVYEPPPKVETPAERMAREQREAMEDLRRRKQAKASETAGGPAPATETQPVPEQSRAASRAPAETGVPLEVVGERAPDILDAIDGAVTRGKVRFPPEFKDYIARARGKAREMMSVTKGEAADTVLDGLHREGMYRRVETLDDLAEAMVRAGDSRIGERARQAKAKKKLAELEREAMESRTEAAEPGEVEVDENNDFLAPLIAKLGGPSPEETEVAADELREGPTRATVPQHESATVQRREQTGGPEGRQLPDRGGQPGSQPPTPQSAPRPVRSSSPESKALLAKAVEAKVDALYSDALSKGKEDLARGIASAWRDIQPMLEAMSPADALREINRIMDVARAQRNEALRGPVRVPAGVDAKTGKLQYDEVTIGPEVAVYNIGRRRAAAIYREAILEQQAGDAVERWLDRAIAATDPAQGRLMEGVTGLPVWLTQTAANLALRAAKLAYTTTRDLARAIAAGVEALREMQIAGFNEAEARDWLTRTLGERATGQKIGASSAVSEQTKQAVREYLYERRNNAADDALAAGLLERVGLGQAEAIIRERSADVPGAVWSRLLRVVTRQMAEAEREARANQDETTAQAWASRQAALWDTVLPQITDVAQTLQALNDLVAMSPDGMVAMARNTVDRANTERLEHRRAETEQMQQALDEGRKTGIEAVRNDPEVNAKARAAVDEAVTESEETRRAVIMELAEPWAQSSAVLAHARAAVRAKAEELLNRGPRPPGMTPTQHLRQILDDLAKRAAGIAAWHYQGAEPGTTLAAKLEARLGLTKEHAERLAKQLDAEFARQFEAAKRKLSKRIAEARARLALRQADKERALGTQTGLDKAIMRQLRALNTRLGEVLRAEAGRRDETGRHVAERVVAESGLTGAKADALRAALTRRWNELVSEAQRRALAAIEKRSGVRVGRTLRNAFDKLVELDRLGALSSEKFFEVVKKALKLQRLTEADARKLRRLVELAQSKPDGWQRQRAMTDVLTFVEELKGDLSWWQAAMSIWYANIFSSPTTHAKNIIGNGLKLMETMAVELLHRPLAARQLLWALAEGTRKGMLEAASIMRTGKVEGTRLLKLEPARPLEAKRLPGNLDYLLTFFRVVGRAMATEDMVPFKANEEIRWAMVARRIARREGLPMWGRKLNQRVQELMHNTKADWESAKVQAAKEGLTGLDLLRRANEIIEQRREASMPGSLAVARQFALKQTYNADPYGLMGAIAGVLNNMNRSLQFTRFFVPVVRIVANLANESLNYFPPVGLSRVALTRWGPNEVRVFGKSWYFRNRIDGKPITDPDAMFHQTAVAAAGTVLFTALAWAVGRSIEDEDPPIALYGQGPRSRSQREQLRKTGWIPDSIKIGGRYYSYKESQLSIPLAILGNWFDAIRWKHLNEEDALNRMAYAAQTFSNTFLDRGMLSGVTSLLDALNPTGGQAGTQLTKALAKPASSIVVPNALRFIDNVFDPQMYEVDDVQGALLAQVPWARRAGRPALNAFGEPVERRPLDQFIVPQKPDPLVVLLASKSAWVPMPILDKQTVGKAEWGKDWLRPMTPDEYYQWIATSGPEIRRRLTDEMDRIRDMDDDEARAFVSKIAEQERAKAKREFVY